MSLQISFIRLPVLLQELKPVWETKAQLQPQPSPITLPRTKLSSQYTHCVAVLGGIPEKYERGNVVFELRKDS